MDIRECGHADVTIRPMATADIPAAVAVHLAAFPRFFLSELGPRFLGELYRGFVRDGGLALVAEDDRGTGPLGIIAGTCQPEGFFRRLLWRRWWAFGLASLPLVARRPGALRRVLRAVRYRGEGCAEVQGALLSTVCVDPRRQRGGIGTALVRAFARRAAAQGARQVYLMADAQEKRVNAFYRSLGFAVRDEVVTPEGRSMHRYVLALGEETRASEDQRRGPYERPRAIGHEEEARRAN